MARTRADAIKDGNLPRVVANTIKNGKEKQKMPKNYGKRESKEVRKEGSKKGRKEGRRGRGNGRRGRNYIRFGSAHYITLII